MDVKHGWHDRICMTMKSSYARLSYNTNDGDAIPWNQYGGTGVTLTADMKARIVYKDADLTKLGLRFFHISFWFGYWSWMGLDIGDIC